MMNKDVIKNFTDEFNEALEYVLKKRGVSEEILKECRGKDSIIVLRRPSPKLSNRMLYLEALSYLEDKWSKEDYDL